MTRIMKFNSFYSDKKADNMNTPRTQRISELRETARSCRKPIAGSGAAKLLPWQRAIMGRRMEVSAKLLGMGACEISSKLLMEDAIKGFEKDRAKFPARKGSFDLEINQLKAIRGLLFESDIAPTAEGIYRAFAPKKPAPEYPEKELPEKLDPTGGLTVGLQIFARAHPDWFRFALSVFPYRSTLKLLPESAIKKGVMASMRPDRGKIYLTAYREDPKSVSDPDCLAIDESAVFIATLYENLMFKTFLSGFFTYPIFTKLCYPFVIDLGKKIAETKFVKKNLASLCLPAGEGAKISADTFFNSLRMVLRQADVTVKICSHYESRFLTGRGNSIDNSLMWDGSYQRSKVFASLSGEMLSLAEAFELTDPGNNYLFTESSFLKGIKTEMTATASVMEPLSDPFYHLRKKEGEGEKG